MIRKPIDSKILSVLDMARWLWIFGLRLAELGFWCFQLEADGWGLAPKQKPVLCDHDSPTYTVSSHLQSMNSFQSSNSRCHFLDTPSAISCGSKYITNKPWEETGNHGSCHNSYNMLCMPILRLIDMVMNFIRTILIMHPLDKTGKNWHRYSM